MRIRNKKTGQIHEVIADTLYAENIFEEVKDDEIKVGEPKVEFGIEQEAETIPEKCVKETKKNPEKSEGKAEKSVQNVGECQKNSKKYEKQAKKAVKSVKKQRKGAKKNEPSK